MILIFIIGQYTCHLAIKYVSFHQKLKQISEKKDKSYFAFQDQNSDNMPDCTLETYQKFRKTESQKSLKISNTLLPPYNHTSHQHRNQAR